MKKLVTLFVLGLALALGASWAFAEMQPVADVKIPFDFYAGHKKMPAGDYTVSLDPASNAVVFTDNAGDDVILMGTPDSEGVATPDLIFDQAGDSYYLIRLDDGIQNVAFTRDKRAALQASNKTPVRQIALVLHGE